MKHLRPDDPVRLRCRGFYAGLQRLLSRQAPDEARREVEIRAAHQRTRETQGPERRQQDLAAHGVRVGVPGIQRMRRKLGRRCRQQRKFKATTHSARGLPVAEHPRNQDFTAATAPKEVWLSDLTDIPTE